MTQPAPSAQRAAQQALAWLVHAFTAGGAVLALLALTAIERGDFRLALLWLLAALAVDGVDGSLARLARVKEWASRIDGDTLDLVVDYLTYVFVPTLLIVRAGLVPAPLALPLAAVILVSSLYCFARTDLKTDDQYFRGFPALWNLVAFYLLVARPSPEAGAAAVVLFAALTFAPVHFVHPFRVTDYGRWLPALALVWAGTTAALLWPGWSGEVERALLAFSVATAAILCAQGLLRTFRGPRNGPASAPEVSEVS